MAPIAIESKAPTKVPPATPAAKPTAKKSTANAKSAATKDATKAATKSTTKSAAKAATKAATEAAAKAATKAAAKAATKAAAKAATKADGVAVAASSSAPTVATNHSPKPPSTKPAATKLATPATPTTPTAASQGKIVQRKHHSIVKLNANTTVKIEATVETVDNGDNDDNAATLPIPKLPPLSMLLKSASKNDEPSKSKQLSPSKTSPAKKRGRPLKHLPVSKPTAPDEEDYYFLQQHIQHQRSLKRNKYAKYLSPPVTLSKPPLPKNVPRYPSPIVGLRHKPNGWKENRKGGVLLSDAEIMGRVIKYVKMCAERECCVDVYGESKRCTCLKTLLYPDSGEENDDFGVLIAGVDGGEGGGGAVTLKSEEDAEDSANEGKEDESLEKQEDANDTTTEAGTKIYSEKSEQIIRNCARGLMRHYYGVTSAEVKTRYVITQMRHASAFNRVLKGLVRKSEQRCYLIPYEEDPDEICEANNDAGSGAAWDTAESQILLCTWGFCSLLNIGREQYRRYSGTNPLVPVQLTLRKGNTNHKKSDEIYNSMREYIQSFVKYGRHYPAASAPQTERNQGNKRKRQSKSEDDSEMEDKSKWLYLPPEMSYLKLFTEWCFLRGKIVKYKNKTKNMMYSPEEWDDRPFDDDSPNPQWPTGSVSKPVVSLTTFHKFWRTEFPYLKIQVDVKPEKAVSSGAAAAVTYDHQQQDYHGDYFHNQDHYYDQDRYL